MSIVIRIGRNQIIAKLSSANLIFYEGPIRHTSNLKRPPESQNDSAINKWLPLIERRDRDQLLHRGATEVSWRGETSRILPRAPRPLVTFRNRVPAESASNVRGRKIGRLSNHQVGQGRWVTGVERGRRFVPRQKQVDILRMDHQNDGVLHVRLPGGVQFDQNAVRHLVE